MKDALTHSAGSNLGACWERYLRLANERPDLFVQNRQLEIMFDEKIISEYCNKTGKELGVLYESPFHLLLVDLVRDPRGSLFAYERLVDANLGNGVVIIPRFNGRYVLLRQFRHALRSSQLAFPRGYGEKGLDSIENACKELKEELRASVSRAEVLGYTIANSGVSGTKAAIVLCEVEQYEAAVGYEGIEDAFEVASDELDALIEAGEITDGFTVAAWGIIHACKQHHDTWAI